ncbi:MAG: hypothetical protein UW46_C0001G0056 [Candidatus Yanofskybacteria bacterium GW2011_GWF1_44_227]|uniref:Uncharacterized protein n=1 Tax=Candidatus Yanofskybacteria bacterium GW2011_GWE2_40_11 TaxID=1619033 RepID=A0A0G0T134_9BACT|nr:MAG: hypothetical protein UT69_C0022G0006 [Candidatus Yanofskybacteria bacterium GW2011_GWE1_40_10]KKR40805.1 MAG: hypothetical protein UT75_C0004G0016 [Candidatus Yanofskybacteria bacterium GW2011_GWE2_40_11]KKT15920.1 MAG: hypothetical protein UV97_C0001G0093 [Candidatus Yanofskybacteria bacterium GW2011_GWF2_43_596]KKT53566.1 MAG: hypothetical protein UW46_C0001G0056 [Candidatus Yanofskybacteria bacterium GW2011_GWF1_44_227]OGN36091.1 MAG: hypothetical protein A2207_03470 [Candidatus Yano
MLITALIIGAIIVLVIIYVALNDNKSKNLPMVSEDVNLPANIEQGNSDKVTSGAETPEEENNNLPLNPAQ